MKNIAQDIQALLDESVANGSELGVQVVIYHRGELIVDASAGSADLAKTHKVDGDTLFPVFSTTKGIAATLLHLLVERGQIHYDTPIAEVWPEFAAHGKGGITLRHALSHTSGIPNMPVGITHTDLGDWDKMCAAIADLEPVSPPGWEMAYHAITYGWIVGEVARRVDGRSFLQLLHDEICAPLELTKSLYVGIPADENPFVAVLEETPEELNQAMPNDATPQAIPALVRPLSRWMNRPDAHRACLPASTGIMTAQAIAKHYAALLPGGVDGIELLPPERIRLATEPQRPGNVPPGEPIPKHRLGYAVEGVLGAHGFGHDGYGGSTGFAVPAHQLVLGYTRNRFATESLRSKILELLQKALAD